MNIFSTPIPLPCRHRSGVSVCGYLSDYQHISAPGNRICTRGTLFRSAAGYNNEKYTDNRLIISAFLLFLRGKSPVQSGAGGSRTLVQTSRRNAFYKFSPRLIVGGCMARDEPDSRLSSEISLAHRSLRLLSVLLRRLVPNVGRKNFRGDARGCGPCPCGRIRGGYAANA